MFLDDEKFVIRDTSMESNLINLDSTVCTMLFVSFLGYVCFSQFHLPHFCNHKLSISHFSFSPSFLQSYQKDDKVDAMFNAIHAINLQLDIQFCGFTIYCPCKRHCEVELVAAYAAK